MTCSCFQWVLGLQQSYIHLGVMQLQHTYLVLLFHSAAQALGIDFYLEGGEGDVNFCHTSPRALLSRLCPCLLCSRDVIGLDGWKQYSQEKPGDTDTHCQVRCVHRSDGDAMSLWVLY